MTFSEALVIIKQGGAVARAGWNGIKADLPMALRLQVPDANSKMTQPYIYLETGSDNHAPEQPPAERVPWLASQTDLLAEDWSTAA